MISFISSWLIVKPCHTSSCIAFLPPCLTSSVLTLTAGLHHPRPCHRFLGIWANIAGQKSPVHFQMHVFLSQIIGHSEFPKAITPKQLTCIWNFYIYMKWENNVTPCKLKCQWRNWYWLTCAVFRGKSTIRSYFVTSLKFYGGHSIYMNFGVTMNVDGASVLSPTSLGDLKLPKGSEFSSLLYNVGTNNTHCLTL